MGRAAGLQSHTDRFQAVMGERRGASASPTEEAAEAADSFAIPDPTQLESGGRRNGWGCLRPGARAPYVLLDEPAQHSDGIVRIPYYGIIEATADGFFRDALMMKSSMTRDPLSLFEVSMILGPSAYSDRWISEQAQQMIAQMLLGARQARRGGATGKAARLESAVDKLDSEAQALTAAGSGWAQPPAR